MHNIILLEQYRNMRDALLNVLNELADLGTLLDISVVVDEHVNGFIMLNAAGKQRVSQQGIEVNSLAEVIQKQMDILRKPFSVALVGEFSRGKSTLINALLERDVLVPNFRPNTAVRTVIRHGTPQRIRIVYHDNRPVLEQESNDLQRDLADVTSDASSSDNQEELLRGTRKSLAQQFSAVEVYSDFPFLDKNGMEFIDTPGLGSVFEAHHSVAYQVAAKADAVLYVMQYDPGITDEDITFLSTMNDHLERFQFLITKSDIAPSSAKLNGIKRFIQNALKEQIGVNQPSVLAVSASLAMEGHPQKSGIPSMMEALDSLLAKGAGYIRLQTGLGFARSCILWLENVLDDISKTQKKYDESLRGNLDRITKNRMQIQLFLENARSYLNSFSSKLSHTHISRLDNLTPTLQNSFEHAIDLMALDALVNPGKVLVMILQKEIDKLLSSSQNDIWSQGEQINDVMKTLIEAITDRDDLIDNLQSEKDKTESFTFQLNTLKLPIQADMMPPLWRTIPSGASILANLGLEIGLNSIRDYCKQWIRKPYTKLSSSVAEMVVNGVSFRLAEGNTIRTVEIAGIHKVLEGILTNTCNNASEQIVKNLIAYLQPYLKQTDQILSNTEQIIESAQQELIGFERQKKQITGIKHTIELLAEQANNLQQ